MPKKHKKITLKMKKEITKGYFVWAKVLPMRRLAGELNDEHRCADDGQGYCSECGARFPTENGI